MAALVQALAVAEHLNFRHAAKGSQIATAVKVRHKKVQTAFVVEPVTVTRIPRCAR